MTPPNALSLPAAKTGPASVEANRTRSFNRHAVPGDLREIISTARKSGFLPSSIKTDEQAIVAAMKGRELGLPPLQSFASIHVIQGVPTLSASLMLGVAFKRLPGFDYQIVERSTKRCVLKGRRSPTHSLIEVAYSMEDAERAQLASKDNWRKNPAAMLFARCVGVLCRAIAPDTFTGLYTVEEMQDGAAPLEEPLEPIQPVDLPADATVTPGEPEPAQGPSLDAVLADLKSAGETGGEVKTALKAHGWDTKKRSEWTLDMALTIAREIKLPGYVEPAPADDLNPLE